MITAKDANEKTMQFRKDNRAKFLANRKLEAHRSIEEASGKGKTWIELSLGECTDEIVIDELIKFLTDLSYKVRISCAGTGHGYIRIDW